MDHERALARDRSELLAQITALRADHEELVAAAELVATDDEHDPEGSTIAFERARIAALLDLSQRRLADLDRALERSRAGRYGSCEVCGHAIAAARLAALPSASRCVRCAAPSRR